MALAVPVPLSLRRRRWEAIHWILEAASKRKGRGSGKGGFATKVAEEIVSVVEGRSAAWTKRDALHKLAVAARANMNSGGRGRR
jgi:small subunit ribosomal protein S7